MASDGPMLPGVRAFSEGPWRAQTMAKKAFDLPITLRRILKENREYGIFLLEGEDLILFPA